jgi:formate dehydrogenase maturation protein FdhE
MTRIRCAHCGRESNLGYYDYRDKSGSSVAVLYLCDVCRLLLKSIDLNFTIDDEKIQAVKKAWKLNKERLEGKEKDNITEEQKEDNEEK